MRLISNVARRAREGVGVVAVAVTMVGCSAPTGSVSDTTATSARSPNRPVSVHGSEPAADRDMVVAPGSTVDPVRPLVNAAAPTTTAPLADQSAVPPAQVASLSPVPPANIVPVAPVGAPLPAVGSASGEGTTRVQQRLIDLGFWLARPDGKYDLTTRQAVMAFQKYVRLPATGEVEPATAAELSIHERRAFGRADIGTLVEIDKVRQLLFTVVDGRTQWVFNTSTGNGEPYEEPDQNSPGGVIKGVAMTPDGLHHVNRERPVGWWEGDLGRIYRPKYFVGGVAVHGSGNVPNYPASHGCVRVTVEAMDFIWDAGLMPLGLPVWVHQW